MHEQQRARAAHVLDEGGVDCALFSDIESLRWLTGLNTTRRPRLSGSTEAGSPCWPMKVLPPPLLFADNPDCAHASFVNYTIQQPIDAPGRLSDILGETRSRWWFARRPRRD